MNSTGTKPRPSRWELAVLEGRAGQIGDPKLENFTESRSKTWLHPKDLSTPISIRVGGASQKEKAKVTSSSRKPDRHLGAADLQNLRVFETGDV